MLFVKPRECFTCRDKRTRKILLLALGSFEIALTAARVHDLSWRKLVHSRSHGASLLQSALGYSYSEPVKQRACLVQRHERRQSRVSTVVVAAAKSCVSMCECQKCGNPGYVAGSTTWGNKRWGEGIVTTTS